MQEKSRNTFIILVIVVLSFIIPLVTGCGIRGDLSPANENQREHKKNKTIQ